MGDIQEQTLKGVKWTSLETVGVRGIQFVLSLILARLLTPADYGLIGMIAVFIAIATTFIDGGLSNALIRKQDAKPEDFSTMFIFNIGVSLFFYVLIFFSAPLIASFYNQQVLTGILRVISINLITGAIAAIQKVKIARDLNFKISAKCSTLSILFSGIIGIVLAYWGYGVWALVYQSIANTALNSILLSIYCRWSLKNGFSVTSFKNLFGYGSKLLLSSLLHTIYINFTTLVIGKYYSAQNLGFYSRGNQLPEFASSNITTILSKVTFPIFSRIQNDDERLISVYQKYIKATSLVIIFVLLLLCALASPVVDFLLTEKWSDAVPYMRIFCLIFVTDHVCVINLNLLQVKGRSDLFLRLEIVKKIISVCMILVAIPFGVMAICLSRLIYAQIALIINTYYTGKLFGLGYFSQLKDFSHYILYSIIAVFPTCFITYLQISSVMQILIGVILSSTLYYVILRIAKDVIWNDYLYPLIVAKIVILNRKKCCKKD